MDIADENTELCSHNLSSSDVHQTTRRQSAKSSSLLKGKLPLVLLFTYVIYILLGGIIFHCIEYSYREKRAIDPEIWIEGILSNETCLTREDLLSIVEEVMKMTDHGFVLGKNKSLHYAKSFDIGSSIFFSTTLVTTIGYGNITPISLAGKLFCVFFAIIGIPLFFATSGEFGKRLHRFSLTVLGKLKCSAKYKQRGTPIALVMVTSCGFLIYCLLASVIFSLYEGWHYAEALYYTVITLTTVGFGDYYPSFADGGNNFVIAVLYRIFVFIWVLSGLVWMASIISGMSKVFHEFFVTRIPEKETQTETAPDEKGYSTFSTS
ncbi:potassium channel subfamily K member 16-like [Watersipora subatra]|uniref:potassium channel subfamily K member 16-like n=1 Tax=Watersipora subatra TaxID=2589382 RepID=UPI00355B1EFD